MAMTMASRMSTRTRRSTNTAFMPLSRMREARSEEHTSELQSHSDLVCRLLLEKKKKSGARPVGGPTAPNRGDGRRSHGTPAAESARKTARNDHIYDQARGRRRSNLRGVTADTS